MYLQILVKRIISPQMKDALLKEAKTKILDLIKSRGELSTDEAAQELGLAKSTTRQHFQILLRQGLVTSHSKKQPKGRPLIFYTLTDQADHLYPTKDPELLGQLLTKLIQEGHTQWVEQFFEDYWQQKFNRFEKRLSLRKSASPQVARQVLLDILKEDGFMPEIHSKGGQVSLKTCNCPFPEAVKATKIPCRLEAEFLKKVLNKNLKRTEYIPSGESSCTYIEKI